MQKLATAAAGTLRGAVPHDARAVRWDQRDRTAANPLALAEQTARGGSAATPPGSFQDQLHLEDREGGADAAAVPPPNGIHENVSGESLRKRSGRNSRGAS